MTIIHASLSRTHLRATLICAGVLDSRAYLNGVHVELYPGRQFLVSTDGHRMAVFREDLAIGIDSPYPVKGATFTIPRDMVAKVKAHRHLDQVTVTYDTDSRRVLLDDLDDTVSSGMDLTAIGPFPAWRRVMPPSTAADTSPGQFDPVYVADFGKLARLLTGDKKGLAMHIWHRGETGSALVTVTGHPEFRGVLMPYRTDKRGEPPETCPDTSEFKAAPDVAVSVPDEELA